MITTFIFLLGIAIIIAGYAVFDAFTISRTFRKTSKCYLLRQRRDELVYLVAEKKISVNDPLFKHMFQFLETFESVCDHISLKHVFEELSQRKANPFDVNEINEFRRQIEGSHKEVQHLVMTSLRDTSMIVISNSVTLKFLFYVLKITILKRLPIWFGKPPVSGTGYHKGSIPFTLTKK